MFHPVSSYCESVVTLTANSYCRAVWVTLTAQNAAALVKPYVHDGAELDPVAILCEAK